MKSLESTYFWLKKEDLLFPYVIREAVEHMFASVNAGNISAALNFMQQAKDSIQLVDDLEKAHIHIECARVANKAQIPSLADKEIKLALSLLGSGANRPTSYLHTEASATWLLGALLLFDTSNLTAVSSIWGRSLLIFELIANNPSTFLSDRTWYQERCEEMRQAIAEANNHLPTEIPMLRATLNAGSLRYIDILSMIPAGGLAFSDVDSVKIGQIRLQPCMDSFRILDDVHQLYNLRGSRDQITLNPDAEYLAIEVFGDIMNRIGVEHGNYVLLQIQDEAHNGDMVASEIISEDDRAVIRTYLEIEDSSIFSPQTNNPIHHEYQIDDQSDFNIIIHGVVQGVFKLDKTVAMSKSEDQWVFVTESQPPLLEDVSMSSSDFIRAFPVYAEIPAGGPRAVPTETGKFVKFTRFVIDDQIYYLRNLRKSGREINPGRGEVLTLKVNGDSMDLAGIDDGDYVLLNRDIMPESQDIIAAEIRDIDDQATLKRYQLLGSKAILAPESSNDEHQPLEFDHSATNEDDPPFYIQGVAIAILKPISNNLPSSETPTEDVNY